MSMEELKVDIFRGIVLAIADLMRRAYALTARIRSARGLLWSQTIYFGYLLVTKRHGS